MSDKIQLEWKPPGPVAARFMASTAKVQIINGPVGSGKTIAAATKLIRLAARQMPSTTDLLAVDGASLPVRKFRACCVRDTYRQIWKTTLPSWFKRIPRDVGDFVGSEGGPAKHRVVFTLRDGTAVDFQIEFVGIGDNVAEDVLRGYEPTAFYLNELDLLARDVYTYARGRTGRFPEMSEGGPTWHGVLADCNAPPLGNWLYNDIFQKRPPGVDLFIQPSALSADAENLPNLPADYYAEQIEGQPDFYVNRMVKNIAGLSPDEAMQFIAGTLVSEAASPSRQPSYTAADPLIMGVDVGGGGRDPSVFRFRRGFDGRSIPPVKIRSRDPMVVAAQAFDIASSLGVDAIFVDEGGVGLGVGARLRQMGFHTVIGVQFGAASDRFDQEEPTLYANKRAEMHGSVRKWLRHGAIDSDPLLLEDLTAPTFTMKTIDNRDTILLEPKKDIVDRIGHSTDDGDAFVLTFAYEVGKRSHLPGGQAKKNDWDYDPHAQAD